MLKNTLLPLIAGLFIFSACNNAKTGDDAQKAGEGMAQFAGEKEFQDAHETPDSIGFEAAGKMIQFPSADGKQGSAYAVMAEENTTDYLLVIHEWWGLNDHIRQEADRLAEKLGDINVLALDLYDGKVAENREQAGELMGKAQENQDRLEAIIQGAIDYAGTEAQIATIGWCFGGGWSLKASVLAGDQGAGCVMYYGMPVENAKELAPLQADILGIFAKQDNWINEEVVSKFEKLCKATGKDLEVHWFDAQHAFANPSSPRYDEEAAQKANQLAVDFLQNHLSE